MSKLRTWLTAEGFDWENGVIVLQVTDPESGLTFGEIISPQDPTLDQEFYSGYGPPECPTFVAKDNRAIYFPVQSDRTTWIESIVLDITDYCQPRKRFPYPGGG